MTVDNWAGEAGKQDGFRPYAGILAECRGMLEKRAGAALERALAALVEGLEARRQESAGELEKSLSLLQTQDQLRSLVKDPAAMFRTAFATSFRARAGEAPPQTVYGGDTRGLGELSLVDDEQVSEQLAVKSLANRLQVRCEGELPDLEARVAFMLGRESLESGANPLGPTALCETLKNMCWALDTTRETKLMVFDLLAGHFGEELVPIYKDLNELLVARRILPLGRPWVKRAAQDRRQSTRPESSDRRKSTPSVIEQLFSPQGAGASSAAPAMPAGWDTSSRGAELMQMLTRLQMGDGLVALGEHEFAVDNAAAGTSNVVNALLEAGLGKHLGAVEGIVIDVVATLFDYIFDDDRVPAPMKGLIGRMQIPVLKLAMMDHSFFSNRSQPARRLINALAQAAITWDGELTADSWLYRSAETAVLRIQNEFSNNPEVFAACLGTFEHELAEQERRADERAATITGRLEQRERLEIARTVGQNAIAGHEGNAALPASVRRFLAECWLPVLARAALDGGESGEAWSEACATMDELVWSVLPKTDANERHRLVQRLPALLKGLRAGMQAAEIDQGARDTFFTELVKLHAAAIKAGMTPPAAPSPAPPVASAAAAEPLLEAPLFPTGRRTPAAPVEEPQETFEVEMLRRGDWLELTDEAGEVRRVRLTWISPARTMYLFANRQGQRALALTRSELARRFARKEAMAANDQALMDRIVDNVLDSYQTQA